MKKTKLSPPKAAKPAKAYRGESHTYDSNRSKRPVVSRYSK